MTTRAAVTDVEPGAMPRFGVIRSGVMEVSLEGGITESRPTSSFIECNGMRVVIDTAHPNDDRDAYVDAMRLRGFTPADVDAVVFTHLHPDHFGHKDLFERAVFVINGDERFGDFWFKDDRTAVLHGHALLDLRREGIIVRPCTDREPDLRHLGNELYIRHIPGHTRGSAAIFATISGQVVAWAGDTFLNREYYDRWEPPHCSWQHELIYEHMSYIQTTADIIVPGHGPPFLRPRP